jgi:hypothetical protein
MPEQDDTIKFEQPSGGLLIANRYVWVIVLVVALVTLSLGYFLVLQNRLSNISSAREGATSVNADAQDVENLVHKVSLLSEDYQALAADRVVDLNRLKQILPHEPQIAEIFVLAEDMAFRRGFYLENIDIVDTSEAKSDFAEDGTVITSPVQSVSIAMSVMQIMDEEGESLFEGDPYDLFKLYLDDLEKNIRLLDIESVSFIGIESPDTPLGITLQMNTYFVPN